MNKEKLLFLFVFLSIACSSANCEIPSDPKALGNEHIEFNLPDVERWTLENGLEVVYKQAADQPFLKGALFFPGGKYYEAKHELGLSSALGAQLREGGTKKLTPEGVTKKLDSLAAKIETSYGENFGTLSFSSLREDFEEVFSLASDVLLTPRFDLKRLELWKSLATEGIRRRRDDPDTIASIAMAQLVYGNDNPLGRSASIQDVSKINKEKIQDYAKRFIRPNGAWLVITGGTDSTKIKQLVEKNFGDWKKNANPLPPLPQVNPTTKPGIYCLERDFAQSTISFGHIGPEKFPAEFFEMGIYNRVFAGAGFGSKLFDVVRTQMGLAYDVSGGITPAIIKGVFAISLGSKNETALSALAKSLEIIRDSKVELPEQVRFQEAKSAVERSFVFKFDSAEAVASRYAQLKMQGYPEDFDSSYLKNVEKVSPESVREMAKKWIKPEDFVILIIGKNKPEDIKRYFKDTAYPVYRFSFEQDFKLGTEVK